MHLREQFPTTEKSEAQKREEREKLIFEECEVDKIRLNDKKSGSTSHDPRCNRRRKQRQRLPETAFYVPESRAVRKSRFWCAASFGLGPPASDSLYNQC